MRFARALASVLVLAGALAGSGCGDSLPGSNEGAGTGSAPRAAVATAAEAEEAALLAELRRFEDERRSRADFGAAPASDALFGADPYVIRAVGRDRFVGILRGVHAVVLLDGELNEIARTAAPASPSGLVVAGGSAFVVGERASVVQAYRVGRDRVEALAAIPLVGARALRDVAAGPDGVLYAVDEEQGRLFTLTPDVRAPSGYEVSSIVVGAGAFRVTRTKGAVIVACLLEHTIAAYRVDGGGRPSGAPAVIRNDGPLWSFAASEEQGDLIIASGGVEDRPLDRTHGSFENVDSFLYLDRVEWGAPPRAVRLAEVNLSEHGVVLPKAVALSRDRGELSITATGYGGEAFASIHVREGKGAPEVVAYPLPPGTSSMEPMEGGGMVIANPLLDAWILYRTEHLPGAKSRVAGPRDDARSAASRLGEALVYTTLMAPWNRSDGPLSRFTCETCHFEGYVDGRVHATGRGDVRATTKPLLGLFNNRPHFSRAMDPDLSAVAHNEFRVAGARSGHTPVFDLKVTDRAWFDDAGVTGADLTAVGLRRAFMTFLMEWSHRSSAITAGRTAFSDEERRGAAVFRDRCEGCHEARLASDVAASRVPFDRWEAKIFSDAAPIVWGQARYEKTGVEPYVHAEGARVPSLRRLYKKHPYFTNGTAKSLADVLARVRTGDGAFLHDAPPSPAPAGAALAADERAALEAFLKLL